MHPTSGRGQTPVQTRPLRPAEAQRDVDPSALRHRLQSLPEASSLRHLPHFDARDDAHLEEAAAFLIERFRATNDAEALALLFELSHERLHRIARQVTRQLAVALDPDDLVAGFMARLFVDVRRPLPTVRRFLGLAHTAMRNDARNQLRAASRAFKRGLAWHALQIAPDDPARALDERERAAACARIGATVAAVVQGCFHGLAARDRRILLLREVESLSYEDLSREMGLPANQVGTVLKRARDRLLRRVAQTLAAGGAASKEDGA